MEDYLIISPCCTLSILSNLCIIHTFLKYSELKKTYEYQFVAVFAFFDMVQGISTLIPSIFFPSIYWLCTLQGILIQFSSLSSILWVSFIALAIYQEVVLIKKRFAKGFLLPIILIISFSAFSALFPLIYDPYRLAGGWCWFEIPNGKNKIRDYFLRFGFFYGIVWFVLIFNFTVYVLVRLKAKKEIVYDFIGMNLVRRLRWYPWILCFCYMPLSFVRVLEGFAIIPTWFLYFASCVMRLIGFCNGIVYFKSEKVRNVRKSMKASVKNIQTSYTSSY